MQENDSIQKQLSTQSAPTNNLWIAIIIIVAVSLALVLSASELYSATESEQRASLQEFTAYLDERIPLLMEVYDIPGVNIALIQGGETAWTKAYGYADLETGRKMTPDTYCRVESISKSVTAWGVMKLVQKGTIELDNPVASYIKNWDFPESEFAEEKVTVRQLLSHSAGMPLGTIGIRYSPEEETPSLEESLSKDAVLKQEPGLSFSYSNTGFNLLELLIEEVTGRDFAEYMQEEVLIPLGMLNSSFTWSEEFEPAVPVGYDLTGNPIPVYIYPEKASGGLFATVEDIATFVTAGMTNLPQPDRSVLTVQSINQLYTPMVEIPGFYGLAFKTYGLGHFIESVSINKKAVSHGGQGTGWMTQFYSVPETGDGIVILTNSQRSWPFFAYILSDWAEWNGFASIGMGRIIWAKKILWTLLGLTWAIILWQVWRLLQGLVSHRRRFAPLSRKSRPLRLIQSITAIVLASFLLWCINQDYLFITSLFPIASNWLAISTVAVALVLFLSALFPCTE